MQLNYGTKIIIVWRVIALLVVSYPVFINCNSKDASKAEILPACQACKLLADSFKKGIERTSRFKFEGGDSEWEEKKQVRYADSEIRLTEIQEELCSDVTKGQNQCHQLASDNEENFETWWFKDQKTNADIYDWLCINTLRVCCPKNTFGADCSACPGGVERPCNNRGTCRGEGSRSGSGECRCSRGYTGLDCGTCTAGFYNGSIGDEEEFVCIECYRGCKGHCRDGTAKGCEVCADGWLNHPEFGCQDIDECFNDIPVCNSDQFCVNTPGSFDCIGCHVSCASCVGDAPDECKQCKTGYTKRNNHCLDSEAWWRSVRSNWGHYLTYLGLCVATVIVLKKSWLLASVLGMVVAVYIAVSEYTLSSGQSPASINILPSD